MPALLQPSFGAGELSPAALGRIDLAKYRAGCKTLRNAFVLPQGGVCNRAGTQLVAYQTSQSFDSRLIPFVFSPEAGQSYVLEFAVASIRFHQNGAPILSGGAPYQIGTSYGAGDLPLLKYTQSADVMTITHPAHPPQELRRYADTDWTLTPCVFGTAIAAPTGLTATPEGHTQTNGTAGYTYVVTALDAQGRESLPSNAATAINDPSLKAGAVVNQLAWTAVAGAVGYNVYESDSGLYGLLGANVPGTSFTDNNIAPATSDPAPVFANPLSGENPGVVEIHQQRRVFAQSYDYPQTLWFTQANDVNNFDYSRPSRDSDGITATLSVKQVNQIKALVSLSSLVVFTDAAEFSCDGDQTGTVTPSAVAFRPQSYIGASDRPPIVAGSDILFEQARGSTIRQMRYDFASNNFRSYDRSVLSQHLFAGYSIHDWCWSQEPYRLVWACRNDGALLSMTFNPDEELYGWARHDTFGSFNSICCIPENGVDAVYVAVTRPLAGGTARFIERLADRRLADGTNWFVDCALSYSGAATARLSGLNHLAGSIVSAVTSGGAFVATVAGDGSVTLPVPVTSAVVGLAYTSQVETTDPENPYFGTFAGALKRVPRVTLRLFNAEGLSVGPDAAHLTPIANLADYVPFGAPFTGDIRVTLNADWGRSASVFIQQSNPLPFTLLDVVPHVQVGDKPDQTPPIPQMTLPALDMAEPKRPPVPVAADAFARALAPIVPETRRKPGRVAPDAYARALRPVRGD